MFLHFDYAKKRMGHISIWFHIWQCFTLVALVKPLDVMLDRTIHLAHEFNIWYLFYV
jgi:hypothetical protein